ncbi:biopolymer transporter ExbD [Cupriavidus sp. CV2]|uniref:ExbD/TolR family protein n=1 Tax=Cupriavidus ulmosensis TaxID=3065913 RepID=UPI00296AD8FF|nr:biopolymer transporter ExbD [Cupriavidus sp. CV2]MDW3683831.1 biopolymer transporter ExbD [Cupriavidus sp. CV2]
MKNSRSHYFGAESKPRIEIIPMIDIMMFLLVFFMLSTLSMIQGSGLKLDLPQSSTAAPIESAKLTLGVNKEGTLFVDSQPISETELVNRLKSLRAEKKVDVIIMGDEGTEYQKIVKAMDVARTAGITSVALATSGK